MQAVPGLNNEFVLARNLPPWLLRDEENKPMQRINATPAGILGIVAGIGLAGAELATHHQQFTLSNLVACAVASDILQRVGIRSFRSAAVLCAGVRCTRHCQRDMHLACTSTYCLNASTLSLQCIVCRHTSELRPCK